MTKPNRRRAGRKRTQGVDRTPSGAISRSKEAQMTIEQIERTRERAEHKLALEAATWKRRQVDPTLSVEQARMMEHGSVIARMLAEYRDAKKRKPDGAHPNEFTQMHYDTALRFSELHAAYLGTIEAKQQRSSSDFDGAKGYDGRDPFDSAAARRHRSVEDQYKAARTVILEAGSLCMMAVEAIVLENKPVFGLQADLRLALNRLAVLWRLQQAA